MKRLLRAALLTSALSSPAFAVEATPPQQVQPKEKKESPQVARPTLDVVFVLDTTGSMGGLIEGAKQKIWSIASRMASGTPTPRIRVGLVGFRDKGDDYVTKRFDLTDDLDAAYANLNGFAAGGGGDGPEHVGQAMGEAVKLMSWSQEAKAAKMIFVVGDAPAHDDYKDEWNTVVWSKAAIAKGIVVNTVRCGEDVNTEKQFREIARLADGTFVSIQQAGGMVATATPYDAELSRLSGAIADKTMVGGTVAARSAGRAELEEIKNMPASVASDRAGFMAKTAPAAPMAAPKATGSINLNAAPALVNTMKDEELPEAVRAVEKSKREAFVKAQVTEQAQLQTQLVELSKKRDAFLKVNVAQRADAFDDQVFESVKKSAEKAGVAY